MDLKKVIVRLLSGYKMLVSPILHSALGVRYACRYSPTCSEYARIHIVRDGVIKGGAKSLLRLLLCQPFVRKLPRALQK